jgi:hypothetical protein
MFDSGAFSAWQAGEPPLKASELAKIYEQAARWCEGKFKATWFITLDVMPGAPNRSPTPEEVAFAVKQTDLNHTVLVDALPGRILSVFHRGESPERLNEVQDMSPNYICLSPRVRISDKRRIGWSLSVAAHVTARDPKTQFHGLATTGREIMRSVRWRSVDSTAWIFNAAMAIIFVEHDDRIVRVPIGRHDGSRRHFDLMDEQSRARVERLVVERGFDLAELRVAPGARQVFNMWTIAEWSKRPTTSLLRSGA